MIELYAITDHPCPALPGNAADLEVVAAGRLAAVCAPPSPHDTVESLWRHEEVVELLMRDRDLLPIRLGTVVADRHTVMDVLATRQVELVRALDRVRGAVEVSVRAMEPAPARPDEPRSSGEGASYLRVRSLARGAPRGDARTVHRALVRLARQAVVRPAPDAREVLRAAYLVDRRRLPELTEAVQRIARELPLLELLCTGPWPPYSFTDA